jgi:hypothetical protein
MTTGEMDSPSDPQAKQRRDYWEKIKNKLREKWQVLQHGPYTQKFEVLFKEYLTQNYGLEAIHRLWNDYDVWWKFANTPDAKELAAEFGLNWSYHPESDFWEVLEKNVEIGFAPDDPFFRDVSAVKRIPYGKIRWSDLGGRRIESNLIKFDNGKIDLSAAFLDPEPDNLNKKDEDDFEDNGEIPIYLKEGRFIQVEIDLHKPKTQILAEIDRLIEFCLGEVRFHFYEYLKPSHPGTILEGRGHSHDDFPFKVFRMHHEEGKSLLGITRELFPEIGDEDPNIDPEAKRQYEKVRRAYAKAKQIIKIT